MAKIGNLKCKVGTYEKDGQTKGKYVDVGVLMQGQDGGMFVLLNTTFNPAGVPNPEGKESVLVSVFTDEQSSNSEANQYPQQGQQQAYQPQQQQSYQANQQYQTPHGNVPVEHQQMPQPQYQQ